MLLGRMLQYIKSNPISWLCHGSYVFGIFLLNSLVSYWAGDGEIHNCNHKLVCFSFELLNFCVTNFETLLLGAYILKINVSSS